VPIDCLLAPRRKRPLVASECHRLGDGEHWRREIIRDVTRKVAQIQNAGLGEHRARDLNDEINRLLREKVHWEKRIVELGGTDYAKASGDLAAAEGKELPGSGGYMYFGVMKDLPGIRELFAEDAQRRAKRKRGDILKSITPDYYGWRDDEDEHLAREERAAERDAQARADQEWEGLRKLHGLKTGGDLAGVVPSLSSADDAAAQGGGGGRGSGRAGDASAGIGSGIGSVAHGSFEGAGMRALAPLPSEA